ncbi:MAG: putative transcriptional regulator with C-terminal CBS domain protein [Haloquadratum sp. J07HQX50]|jgi:Predicted transcriptional regulator with C-terminal CBS domains|nr:MAG: putative transcriptional regulator with C-terminal CBS domain protein [Haloquadratum sp. J07HQX50]
MTSRCTAGDIATSNPEECPSEDAQTAIDWLTERDYDSAPVLEDGRPIGYVTRDAAEAASLDSSLAEITEPLTVDVLIASDSTLDAVLEALYERPFYYLADRNQVTGILTRADLNTEPVYQHLCTKLSQLEQAFRNTIQECVPDWVDTTPLHPDILDDVDERLTDAKDAGVALDRIHYAQFSTLVTIIGNSDKASQALGFGAGHQASSRLDPITDLRNDVAHSTPIIQNTDRGLTESGRTITHLLDQYQLIEELLATHKE